MPIKWRELLGNWFFSAGVIGQKAGVKNSMGQAQHTVILKWNDRIMHWNCSFDYLYSALVKKSRGSTPAGSHGRLLQSTKNYQFLPLKRGGIQFRLSGLDHRWVLLVDIFNIFPNLCRASVEFFFIFTLLTVLYMYSLKFSLLPSYFSSFFP